MIRVLLLMMTATTLTMSQGMVLCFGCDGHVAIEPAGHDCCIQQTGTRSQAADSPLGVASSGEELRCQSCMDVSLDYGATDRPPTLRPSQIYGADLAAYSSVRLQDREAAATESAALSLPASGHPAFLCSVVLQV
jgi:hypothetical protein